FLVLAPPRSTPAEADLALTFSPSPLRVPGAPAGSRWDVALPVWLTGEGRPAVVVANAHEGRRARPPGAAPPLPRGPKKLAPSPAGVLALDWRNDNRTDLVLAGAGGVRFFRQKKDGSFEDVSAATGLAKELLEGDYYGAWAADVEMDGDLDVVLARR